MHVVTVFGVVEAEIHVAGEGDGSVGADDAGDFLLKGRCGG